MRRILLIFLVVALPGAILGAPASAPAAGGNAIVRDCADNSRIDGHYTAQQYRDALANLPADVDEYTDCRDIIRSAQLATAGKHGGGGSNGPTAIATSRRSAHPASKAERALVAHARRAGDAPVRVGEQTVTPGATSLASNTHSLPGPLLAALILLSAAAIAVGAHGVNSRARARRRS